MKQVEYYKNGNRTLRIKYEGIKKLLEKKDKEIERLNNIINELEKYMIDLQKLKGINQQGFSWGVCQEVLDKLQELKGDGSNE